MSAVAARVAPCRPGTKELFPSIHPQPGETRAAHAQKRPIVPLAGSGLLFQKWKRAIAHPSWNLLGQALSLEGDFVAAPLIKACAAV